jgi:hypothetical protein
MQSYPGNYQALKDGRITRDQFDDMAVHKFCTYGNDEDLDVNQSYPDLEKLYPVITFSTKNGRDIVSPTGFVNHMLASMGEPLLDDPIDDTWGDSVSFTYRQLGWTWSPAGATSPKVDVIYYTFGGCFGKPSPLGDYCTDVDELWD